MYNRNRLSPISLSWKYPVTKFIIYLAVTNLFLCKEIFYLFLSFFNCKSCEETWIYHLSCSNISKCSLVNIYRTFTSLYNLNHRKWEFLCKFPVTVIMCRNSHNCTCSVCHKYIIWYPDRNLSIIYRIYCLKSVKYNTCLVLCKLCTLKIRLSRSHLSVFHNGIPVFDFIFVFVNNRMLRRYYHICCTKKCVWSCCINTKFIFFILNSEIYFCTFWSSYPVSLWSLYSLDVIYIIQSL